MAGTVEEVTGPLSFHVRLEDGRLVCKHMDHIRRRTALPGGNQVLPEANVQEDHEPIAISPEENAESVQDMQDKSEAAIKKPALESNNKNEHDLIPTAATVAQSQSPLKVYPTRDRKPPDRFEPKF